MVIAHDPASRGFAGKVLVTDLAGVETARETTASDCERVARILTLFVALAVDDVAELPPPAPAPVVLDVPRDPPPDPPPIAEHPGVGVALTAFSGYGLNQLDDGIHAMIVAGAGSRRLGASIAVSREESWAGDVRSARGTAVRAGAVLSIGAPWSRGIVGFVGEAGALAGTVQGIKSVTSGGCNGSAACACDSVSCSAEVGRQTRWRFLVPYASFAMILQIPLRSSLRPFLSLTHLISLDFEGTPTFTGLAELGVSWLAW